MSDEFPPATSQFRSCVTRLTARTYADGKNDSFAYDPASRLTGAVSGRFATR